MFIFSEIGLIDWNDSMVFKNDPAYFVQISHFTPEVKNLILELGPCQPVSEDLPKKMFPKDMTKDKRSFKETFYFRILPDNTKCRRDWLSYSVKLDKIFCIHCLLFGINLHENLSKCWTKVGFSSWKHCLFAIQRHETTSDHIMASLKFKMRQTNVPLIPALEFHQKSLVLMNRQVVKELLDIVLYLARHNLSFRGKNEKWSSNLKGNFKDLVLLMAKNSAPLSDHIEQIKLKGKQEKSFITWKRQNQLIEAISEDISIQIRLALKKAQMFSITVDSTFDASRKEQVSFVIRYVDEISGQIHERLLAIKESPVTTGKDLFELFLTVMNYNSLNWKTDLIGQSYDGGSNMRGHYNGLQAHIRKESPKALFIWCHAHRLALVVKQAVSSDANTIDLFGNLKALYTFLWCSKKRAALFRESQQKLNISTKMHAVKRVSTTRWSSHYDALNVVIKCHEAVINTLNDIKQGEGSVDALVGSTCSGLIIYLTSYRFLLTAFTFKFLFDIIEPLTKQFQAKDIDMLMATNVVVKSIDRIKELRKEGFDDIVKAATDFSNNSEVDFEPLKEIRLKRVPKMFGNFLI